MIAHEPRTLGYYAASHWFQTAAAILLLGILALFLLKELGEVEAQAERQAVDLTVRNMRTGMQFAMGEALMRQQEKEIADWAGSNPIRWLEVPPTGYRGECGVAARRNLPEGAWCFETSSRQLVYRPRNGPSSARPGDGQACGDLAWHVVRVAGRVASGGFVGVRIEPASTCRFVERS